MKKSTAFKNYLFSIGIFLILALFSCGEQEDTGRIKKTTDKETGEITYEKLGEINAWTADTNHHGGIREWYGGKPEPTDCHIVLYTPGAGEGGGSQRVFCAGSCADGEICNLKEISTAESDDKKVVTLACRCE